MKNKVEKLGMKVTKDNPYFKELSGFRDLRANDKVTRAALTNIIYFLLLVILVLVIGITIIGTQSKIKTMVFMSDSKGALAYGGFAEDKLKITSPMIANQLADYLIALRQIPQDMDLKNAYLLRVKAMSTPELFNSSIIPMIKQRYANLKGNTIKVTVHSILPIGKYSWQIDWDEVSGNNPKVKYKGNITFMMNPNINDQRLLLINPLGIIVSDFNYNQEM